MTMEVTGLNRKSGERPTFDIWVVEETVLDARLSSLVDEIQQRLLIRDLEDADVTRLLLPALGNVRVFDRKVQCCVRHLGDLQAWRKITTDNDVLILLLGRSL